MLDLHIIQSILKLQQQNLDLSIRSSLNDDSNNKNSNHLGSIIYAKEEESYHSFSTSSLDDCLDGNDNSRKSHALFELTTKEEYEEQIIKQRLENLWRSLPE